MSSPGTVDGDEQLRLFLGLRLAPADSTALAEWQERELAPRAARHPGRVRVVPRENLHVTLAFLGRRPGRDVARVVGALREAVSAAGPQRRIELSVQRYRETRGAAMLVFADADGRGAALAREVQGRLEALGVYRREARDWLPHLTVLRYRERPRLAPPLPAVGTLVPSDAAAFVSLLHPSGARYEVLESVAL